MTQKLLLTVALLSQLLFLCKKESKKNSSSTLSAISKTRIETNRPVKMAIVSDIHYMHPSLLVNNAASGTAFQNYLNDDPKMVQYSHLIWKQVMHELSAESPDILLVPGDISKDGEKISHQAMAAYLNELRHTGMKVYVIPGNHDINNAKAKKYDGNNAFPVDKTSQEDFATIYANLGYKDAIARDNNSLSYIVQPQAGLRIICIDASKYEEKGPEGDVAAGRIKPETLTWVLAQLAQAKKQNITVFAMMHHNLIEHYAGQSKLDPGYVIDNWKSVANTLIDAGLKVIFTGHYHANDISSYTYNSKELFDIQTGSLVTAPSPYRIVTMKDNKLEISSNQVQTIKTKLPGNRNFVTYSNTFLSQHLNKYFNLRLADQFHAPVEVAGFASSLFANGIMAHFAGDEQVPPDQRQKIQELAVNSQELASAVHSLWTDSGIKDNKTTITY